MKKRNLTIRNFFSYALVASFCILAPKFALAADYVDYLKASLSHANAYVEASKSTYANLYSDLYSDVSRGLSNSKLSDNVNNLGGIFSSALSGGSRISQAAVSTTVGQAGSSTSAALKEVGKNVSSAVSLAGLAAGQISSRANSQSASVSSAINSSLEKIYGFAIDKTADMLVPFFTEKASVQASPSAAASPDAPVSPSVRQTDSKKGAQSATVTTAVTKVIVQSQNPASANSAQLSSSIIQNILGRLSRLENKASDSGSNGPVSSPSGPTSVNEGSTRNIIQNIYNTYGGGSSYSVPPDTAASTNASIREAIAPLAEQVAQIAASGVSSSNVFASIIATSSATSTFSGPITSDDSITALTFYGDGSHLTGIAGGGSFSTSTARGVFSNTATGLTYSSGTGVTSLTAGYNIPLTASTTEWANNLATTAGLTTTTSGLSSIASNLSASTTALSIFYQTPSTRITAGTGLSWSGNTLNSTGVTSIGGLTGAVSTSSLGIVSFSTSTTRSVLSAGANLSYDSANGIFSLATSTIQAMVASSVSTSTIRGMFSSTATGLTYSSGTGVTSLTAGYNIPLTASTTEWASKVSSQWTTSGANISYVAGNVGIGASSPISQLANTSVNTLDGAGTGSDLANGLTWASNNPGYVISAANSSTASNANGLFVSTAGTSSTNRILTLNANGADIFTVQGNGTLNLNGNVLVDSIGQIWSPMGHRLTDQYGAFLTNAGNYLADPGGNIYAGDGTIMSDTSGNFSANGTASFAKGSTTIDSSGNVVTSGSVTASSFYGDGSNLTGITSFSTTTTRNVFSSTATGLTYNSGTGVTSLTAGYVIPLAASTTEWASKVSSQWTTSGGSVSYSGNVGIGTTNSSEGALKVAGSIYSTAAETDSVLNGGGPGWQNMANFIGTGGWWGLRTATDHSFNLDMLNSNALTVKQSGFVGIGTTTPGYKLTVAGDVSFTGALRANGDAGTAGMVLLSNGSSAPTWVATSSLGVGSSLSGGTNGYLARWTSASALSSGLLVDNGSVAGVNATSSSYTFSVQGSAGVNPFSVASSTGASLFTVLANGNVGIGTTTPANALTVMGNGHFTSGLSVGGTSATTTGTRVSMSAGSMLQYSGSEANPRVNIGISSVSNGVPGLVVNSAPSVAASQTGAAIGQGTQNTLSFYVSNGSSLTERARFDTTGFLGIGTTTPVAVLSVQGSTTNPTASLFTVASSTTAQLFTVFANGNVGIGTTTPGYKLTVAGDVSFTGALRANGDAGTAGMVLLSNGSSAPTWVATSSLGISGGGSSQWTTSGSNIYYNTGNVSIGNTASTNFKLKVVGSSGYGSYSSGTFAAGDATNPAAYVYMGYDTSVNAGFIQSVISGSAFKPTLINPNGTGTMIGGASLPLSMLDVAGSLAIGSYAGVSAAPSNGLVVSGNVGIGTTTPGYKLTVAGDVSFTGALRANGNPGTTGMVLLSNGSSAPTWVATSTLGISSGSSLTGTTGQFAFFSGTNTAVGTSTLFLSNGNIGIGTTTPATALSVAGAGNFTSDLTTRGALSVLGTGTSTFSGDISLTGSIVPTADDTYDLGSPTLKFRNLYLGAHSLYINGQEVLQAQTGKIVVSADLNQTLSMQTSGTGDVEFNPTGSGQILLKGNTRVSAGYHFNMSDGSAMPFAGGVAADNLSLIGNTLSSTNLNGGITIAASGTGGIYFTHGNVGIATTSPAYPLTVAGDVSFTGALRANGDAGTAGMVLLSNGSSAPTWVATSTLGISSGASLTGTAGQFAYFSGTNTAVGTSTLFLSNGNIGIGTTTPTARLSISGSAGATDLFNIASSTSASLFKIGATGATYFNNDAGTTGMVLLSNGTGASPTWVATSTLGISGGGGSSQWTTSGSDIYYNTGKVKVGADANNFLATNFSAGAITSVTSYGNSGGSGDRRSIIAVSSTLTPGTGTVANLVDGSQAFNLWWSGSAAGSYIRFDFGAGQSKLITEATYYQTSAASQGVWKWQGSNDASTWTDIGSSFTLGATAPQTITELSGNTSGYRYYQLLGVSGSASSGPYVQEFEFKIDNYAASTYAGLQTYITNGATPGGSIALQTSGGSVGIGIASPLSKLDINGGVAIGTYAGASAAPSNGLIVSGNVGIGSSTPSAKLAITGTAGSGDIFAIASSTGARLFTVLANGNVGIGSTTPYAKITVAGEAYADLFTAGSTTATSTFAGGLNVGNGALTYNWSSGVTSIANASLGATTFDSDSGMISWIDMPVTSASASGTVQSYTAQLDGNPMLSIYGLSDGAGGVNTLRLGVGTTTPVSALSVVGTINSTSLVGGASLSADAAGNIILTPSDERLKQDIKPIESALDKVMKLQGVTFDWKDKDRFGSSTEIGFIAQDVQKIVPEVIRQGPEYMSLNYANMVALVVEAVKELKTRVDAVLGWFSPSGDRINIKGMVCVDEVCVTKDQFKQMLMKSGSVTLVAPQAPDPQPSLNTSSSTGDSSPAGNTASSTANSTSTSDVPPVSEPTSTPEPVPAPAESPATDTPSTEPAPASDSPAQ